MRFFYILIIVLFSCSNNSELVKEFIPEKKMFVEKMEDVKILHTEDGLLKVKINANTIERFQDTIPNLCFSNKLEVIFYSDSGLIESTLNADRAEVDEDNNIMTASGNVVLTSIEGKKLETEELFWDNQKNKIYTNKEVLITTKKEIIKGKGFTSNPDFSTYFISKISGNFKLNNFKK